MARNINQLENAIIKLRENLATMDARDPGMPDALDRMQILRAELDAMDEYRQDLDTAKALLAKHGIAFKIFTRDDVLSRLGSLPAMYTAGDPEKIVQHVMQGDDWVNMSKDNTDDDSTLWEIIKGTAHDHPEWFGMKALEKL